jgi:hypothetical protein
MLRAERLLPVLVLAGALLACNTYRDQLAHGERAFTKNDYERTLALLTDLERDAHRLAPQEQAQYAWLRGMSEYRLGHRAEARHWLSLSRSMEDSTPGLLSADAKQRATQTLDELNGVVYDQGFSTLLAPSEESDKSEKAGEESKARKPPKRPEKKKEQEPPASEAP